MSKRIVITGTSGFIGHNLKDYLQADYDILSPCRGDVDLLDTCGVENYLKEVRADIVIHSAVQRTLGLPEEASRDVLKNNLRMFCNLERCGQYYDKMICIGSGAEYDKRAYKPFMKEDFFSENIPEDLYGLSKYIISKIAEKSSSIFVLRPFGIFGPYEDYNHRFISNAVCKAIKGYDIVIHQNIEFDYIYIDDFCEMVKRFLTITPGYKTYNACRGVKTDILSAAKIIKDVVGSKSKIIVENEGLGREYSGDNSRLLSEIGSIDFTDMRGAIIKLKEFYIKQDIRLEGDY